ncbi:MAG TPA: hypothetical protein VFX59_29450 [Polyangiales bacterium]|nr:hypothetical protein [Polyangiales bacterium]
MLNTQLLGKLCLFPAVCLGVACADPASDDTEQTTDHVMSTLDRAVDYQNGDFVLLNEQAIPSVAVAGAEVRVWVSRGAVDEYRTVKQKSGVQALPEGAAIVREVFRNGALEKLTLLAKGPPGTNPELGDLWFAVVDKDGNILPDKAGAPQVGNLAECVACHKTRVNNAFLFGI